MNNRKNTPHVKEKVVKEESLASVIVDHLELEGDAGSRLRQNDKGTW